MTSLSKAEYHSKRARQERESAERATDAAARNIHRELAERHATIAQDNPDPRPQASS